MFGAAGSVILAFVLLLAGCSKTAMTLDAVGAPVASEQKAVTEAGDFVDYIVSHDFVGDWRYTGTSVRTGKFFLSPRRDGDNVIASFRQNHSNGSTSAGEPVAEIIQSRQHIRFLTPGGYADLRLEKDGTLNGTKQSGSATVSLWLKPVQKAH